MDQGVGAAANPAGGGGAGDGDAQFGDSCPVPKTEKKLDQFQNPNSLNQPKKKKNGNKSENQCPNDPYSSKIMSHEDALDIVTEEYGTLENPKFDYIDESLGLAVPRQQLAAKTYHAPSYKLEPELYGISHAEMKAIRDHGLVGYVERGGKLPSSDFTSAFHENLKTFFARNKNTINWNGSYRGEPAIIVHNKDTGQILIFRTDTKELWTPHHLNPKQMARYLKTGGVGKQGDLAFGTRPPGQ